MPQPERYFPVKTFVYQFADGKGLLRSDLPQALGCPGRYNAAAGELYWKERPRVGYAAGALYTMGRKPGPSLQRRDKLLD